MFLILFYSATLITAQPPVCLGFKPPASQPKAEVLNLKNIANYTFFCGKSKNFTTSEWTPFLSLMPILKQRSYLP